MDNSIKNARYKKRLEIKQTNISLECDAEPAFFSAEQVIHYNRSLLEYYIVDNPAFLSSIEPVEVPDNVPKIIRKMSKAGMIAGVGPMASVAGALAEVSAEALCQAGASYGIAENGGDISIIGVKPTTVIGIHRGSTLESSTPNHPQLAFKVQQSDLPIGICTSSGKIGHSISLGDANAAITISDSSTIADAVATAVANRSSDKDPEGSLQKTLEFAEQIREIRGCIVFIGELVGRVGKLPEIVEVENEKKIDYY